MITIARLADILGAQLTGEGNTVLTRVAAIQDAGKSDVTFLANKKYARHLETTAAAAVILDESFPCERNDIALLRMKDPYAGFVKALYFFHPPGLPSFSGIHPTAVVSESASIGEGVSLGPHVHIGGRVRIGNGTFLMAGVVIGDDVSLGEGCLVYPNASILARASIGNRVIIHAGVRIGNDGFGFAPVEQAWKKIPQIGTVVVEDDVEIGANSTVDRATLGATRIGRGSKLDNLIMIGHNVEIGEDTIIVSQAGVSGSTTIGNHVTIAGQVGIAGHLDIADGVTVTAQSGVSKSLPGKGKVYRGTPAQEMHSEMRILAAIRSVPELIQTVRALEQRIAVLSAGLTKLQEHT